MGSLAGASTSRGRAPLPAPLRELLRFVLYPVLALFGVEVADQWLVPSPGLDIYGIVPRTLTGLRGILLAPWLHRGFAHLAANAAPLVVFAALLLSRGRRELLRVTLFVAVLGGLGVWLIGSAGTIHLGASGLVFGYLGYLLTIGFVERRLLWMLVGVGIFALYGGLLRGLFPSLPFVSWESHLMGFLAGFTLARASGRARSAARRSHDAR